jgi:hypothetical protein
MVGSSEIGTKVLNDSQAAREIPRRRAQGHQGADALHAPAGRAAHHEEGDPHARRLQGPALRFASPTVRDLVAALGATPVGVPPTEIAEQLSKGTIDGAFMDYGGVGIAFKLGGTIKYSTELYAYVTSFGLGHERGLLGESCRPT